MDDLVVDRQPRFDLTDERGEFGLRAGGISGHRDRAQRRQRKPAQKVRRGRARDQDDEVAAAYPRLAQPLG